MIHLTFCDMPLSFNKNDNFLLDILKKNKMKFELSETPDFVFYSCYGNSHRNYQNCVKIFWTVEPVTPNFNECDYAVGFDSIIFDNRYCKRPYWLFNHQLDSEEMPSDDFALIRKFCNFIYSNDSVGEGTKLRMQFAKRLMEYKRIDCPGKVLNNMNNAISPREGNWKQGKLDFIKNYKFTIAFENTKYFNYTTEKMIDPLSVKSIPIYWGNPQVTRDFNENAFVLCEGNDFEDVIERIIELDQNDDKYLKMLHESSMTENYNVNEVQDLEDFFVNIFSKGNIPFNKDPLGYEPKMHSDTKTFSAKLLEKIKIK